MLLMIFNIYCDIIKQTSIYILLDTLVKQLNAEKFDIHTIKQTRKQIKRIIKKDILLYPWLNNVIVCIDKFIRIIENKNNEICVVNNSLTIKNKELQQQRERFKKEIIKLNNEIKKLNALKTVNGFSNTIQIYPE
jgi:hypothetical protein